MGQLSWSVFPWQAFPAKYKLVSKAGAKMGRNPFNVLASRVRSWTYAHILHIKLGWKGLPGANTLTYLAHL